MSLLFSTNTLASHPDYLSIRDDGELQTEKDSLERLWTAYEPYADPDFKSQLALQFHPRFWEMYLGYTLLQLGFALSPKTNSECPDIQIRAADGTTVWLEAIAPDQGTGPDAVPDRHRPGERSRIPEENISLRFTSAIQAKTINYASYRQKGILAPADACIIAVNGGQIPFAVFDGYPTPFIVNPLLGVGKPFVLVEEGSIVDQGFHTRSEIIKVSGNAVSTSVFFEDVYTIISAVLYSRVNWRSLPQNPGSDFIFVHNPRALNPVPKGWPKIGKEYWIESLNIQSRLIS
jgi:type I restriction enzyme S subunit